MTGILITGIEYLYVQKLCYVTSSEENILMDNIHPESARHIVLEVPNSDGVLLVDHIKKCELLGATLFIFVIFYQNIT